MTHDASEYCRNLLREADFDRYGATLFAPSSAQPALWALYAYNAELARIKELVSEPMPGEIRLQWWVDALEGRGHGNVEANPAAAALLDTCRRYALPRAPLVQLAEARRFDLYNDPIGDLTSFEGYCGETVSVLFQLAAMVLLKEAGQGDQALAKELADASGHAGVAYGSLQLLQNLPWQVARRQVYVPSEFLEKAGLDSAQLLGCRDAKKMQELGAVVLTHAQGHALKAAEALGMLPSRVRPAFRSLGLVRMWLKLYGKRLPYEVAGQRLGPVAPAARWRRLWALYRAS
ncbi:phytoene/squalene synthase family protein [Polycladidibacter hongkongensis]|uniref:phytoene/squalene synthase family protein n=1 Tax=Polycladidibacter hongkongensis TaxID=1647556 RepID=UPI00082D9CD7|nr:phytoene/squalene synthase family protein [Pseudovibrio hongkongensis]